jgi:Phage XkdN-like tail assembly chaperone protein, TAC
MTKKFTLSLSDILSKDADQLKALETGEFTSKKLGEIPFTAIDNDEFKDAKSKSMKQVPNGTGGMRPEVDDSKMQALIIISAVKKDTRSDFTFADKSLQKHLGVETAIGALNQLLSPGEVMRFAGKIQDVSGFTEEAAKEQADEVKN